MIGSIILCTILTIIAIRFMREELLSILKRRFPDLGLMYRHEQAKEALWEYVRNNGG